MINMNIDITNMKNVVGFSAFKNADNIMNIIEREGPTEENLRKLYHQLEIMSKLDDESKTISYATEENSPCMDKKNIEKYDEHRDVLFSLMVLHAPVVIILKEYITMHHYVFFEEDTNPMQTIFDIVLINAINRDKNAYMAFQAIFNFYKDDFKDIDIKEVCQHHLYNKYNPDVANFLVSIGIISSESAKKLKDLASCEMLHVFSHDWKTDYKIGYLKNAEIKCILAMDYEKAIDYLEKWLELDMPESSPFEETITDLPSDLFHEVVKKNNSVILKTFLENIEDDDRFDKQAIAEEFDYQFEEFWDGILQPREDDPTEILNIMKKWKVEHGFPINE